MDASTVVRRAVRHSVFMLQAVMITALSNNSCSAELVVPHRLSDLMQRNPNVIQNRPKDFIHKQYGQLHSKGTALLQKSANLRDAKVQLHERSPLRRRSEQEDSQESNEQSALSDPVIDVGSGDEVTISGHVHKNGKAFRQGGFSIALFAEHFLRGVPQHRFDNLNSVGVDIEYTSAYEQIFTFPQRRPFAFNVLLATVKTTLADLAVQFMSSRGKDKHFRIDWKRSALFAVFGCLYVGMAQWFFYISMFSKLCPDALSFANKPIALKLVDRVGQEDLLIQVLVDQFIISPFIYFPMFYLLREFLACGLLPRQIVRRALTSYAQNFKQDNISSICIWFPADLLIFTAPMYMRMPLDHTVALAWTMVMSYMRGTSPNK